MKNKSKYKLHNSVPITMGFIVLLITSLFIVLNGTYFYKENDSIHNNVPQLQAVFKQFTSIFYFTYLSNIFLGIMLIVLGVKRQSMTVKRLFFLSVALITVTFIVYWALISYKQSTWEKPYYEAVKSILTHAIHPIIGFIILGLIRKEVSISSKTIKIAIIIVISYLIFAFIVYLSTYSRFVARRGVVIYSFLDFLYPLFYTAGNPLIVLLLNTIIVIIGFALPIGLIYFWKAVYRIKSIEIKKKS